MDLGCGESFFQKLDHGNRKDNIPDLLQLANQDLFRINPG
jgi:hypothetical protein